MCPPNFAPRISQEHDYLFENQNNPELFKNYGESDAHNINTKYDYEQGITIKGNIDLREKDPTYGYTGQQYIINNDLEIIIDTPTNKGTYDYYPPGITTVGKHMEADVVLWLLTGNSHDDFSTFKERYESLTSSVRGKIGFDMYIKPSPLFQGGLKALEKIGQINVIPKVQNPLFDYGNHNDYEIIFK